MTEQEQQAYVGGFLSKCAEAGVDFDTALAAIPTEKSAQLMVPLATIGGGLGALRSEPGFRMDGAGHGALRSLGTGLGVGLGGLGGALGAAALNQKLDLTPGQAEASKYLPLLTALLGGIGGHMGTKALFGKSLTERKEDKEKELAAARAEVLEELFGQKEAAGKPGLWANIHAKRKRGEKPAKPGDEDYPDAKSWKKTTNESKKKTKK